MKNQLTFTYKAVLHFLLLFAVQACSPTPEVEQRGKATSTWPSSSLLPQEPDALPLDNKAFLSSLPEYISASKLSVFVKRSELQDAAFDFPMHFRKDMDNRVLGTELIIPWKKIDSLVTDVRKKSPTREEEVLERFYYGLKDGKFRVAMAFIPIELNHDFTYKDTPDWSDKVVHEWNGKALDSDSTAIQWTAKYQHNAQSGSYSEDLIVKPQQSGDWYTVRSTERNAKSEEFPWFWELAKLYDHNKASIHDGDEVQLVVNSVTDYREDGDRFYHALCLHLRLIRPDVDVPIDLISDAAVPDSMPLKLRGCDYGNLCPPSCPNYVVNERLRTVP